MITRDFKDTEEHDGERLRTRKEVIMLRIRNVLNIVFILLAVTGMIVSVVGTWETGLYIIMISIPFKMADSAIRLLKI